MSRPSLLLFLILLSATRVVAQGMPGCDCDRGDILAAIRSAETIFAGRIVKASMDSQADESIRIWADTMEIIRGAHEESVPVLTARPEACGIPAYIGNHLLFVIPEDGAVVTRCSGSALAPSDYWIYLSLALVTTELWDSDEAVVRDWLNRFSPYRSFDDMGGYFRLLEDIDPRYKVEYAEPLVRYRGITFDFSEPTYTVRWSH